MSLISVFMTSETAPITFLNPPLVIHLRCFPSSSHQRSQWYSMPMVCHYPHHGMMSRYPHHLPLCTPEDNQEHEEMRQLAQIYLEVIIAYNEGSANDWVWSIQLHKIVLEFCGELSIWISNDVSQITDMSAKRHTLYTLHLRLYGTLVLQVMVI